MIVKYLLLAAAGLFFLSWLVLVLATPPINVGQLIFMLVMALLIGVPAILSVKSKYARRGPPQKNI